MNKNEKVKRFEFVINSTSPNEDEIFARVVEFPENFNISIEKLDLEIGRLLLRLTSEAMKIGNQIH